MAMTRKRSSVALRMFFGCWLNVFICVPFGLNCNPAVYGYKDLIEQLIDFVDLALVAIVVGGEVVA